MIGELKTTQRHSNVKTQVTSKNSVIYALRTDFSMKVGSASFNQE